MRTRGIDRTRRDYVPLGIIDPNDKTEHPSGAADQTWLADHLLRWRDEISVLSQLEELLAGCDPEDVDLGEEPDPAGVIDVPFSVGRR